jgi:hypothetical protein
VLSIVPARFDPVLPANLDPRPKIFGIGFHKTGTTSLGRALRILGFRLQKGFSYNLPNKRIQIPEPVTIDKIRDIAFTMVPRYGAFEDSPWPLLFRELDQAFPGSRFILTERDPERWIRSAIHHFGNRPGPYLDLTYGRENFNIAGNPDDAVNRFLRHGAEVKAYFDDRGDDLLVWDIERDPEWGRLCSFLQCRLPNKPFPHGKDSGRA